MAAAMKSSDPLLTLAANFAMLSLFAIGGANAAIPEMHRLVVETHRWMTDQQFSDLFAISQITPGPNVIITTLIGYQVAGFAGALVATVAMCGPTCRDLLRHQSLGPISGRTIAGGDPGRTGSGFGRTARSQRLGASTHGGYRLGGGDDRRFDRDYRLFYENKPALVVRCSGFPGRRGPRLTRR
jgi:hypothetical protein